MSFAHLSKKIDEAGGLTGLRHVHVSCITQQIEDILTSPRRDVVHSAMQELNELSRRLWVQDVELTRAVLGPEDAESALKQAYLLGKIVGHCDLLAESLAHRADDDFLPTLKTKRLRPLFVALSESPMTEAEMGEVGVAGLGSYLDKLYSLGIITSRRRGKVLEYLLTPTAQHIVNSPGFEKGI